MRTNEGTEGTEGTEGAEPPRLLVISNRLPFTATQEAGALKLGGSVGGVAAGLSSYFTSREPTLQYTWLGWPGGTISSPQVREELRKEALARHRAYPVFLTEDEMENFYHGFCNQIIWPLFHYFPSYAIHKEEYWTHYKRVNEAFCQAVLEVVRPGDTIWVHDYHLMLLPQLLRQQMPDAAIGFFLHIPFPSYELFRLMPEGWGREIASGLLGADLVGFHTASYARYFHRSVQRVLGYEYHNGSIRTPDRAVKIGPYPMGIDFNMFNKAAGSPQVDALQRDQRERISSEKVVISIDRLDYTKGVINRLEAFELFLDRCPQWHNRVTFALVIVPSRVAVEHYQQTKSRIDELVGRINGRFGKIGWTPVLYQYRSLSHEALVALYRTGDVALITPLRDGMNLIAKEYVACQVDGSGVLILSETAGAVDELTKAIIINPNSREQIAEAIRQALEMPLPEQRARNKRMQARLQRYDVAAWARAFLDDLRSARGKAPPTGATAAAAGVPTLPQTPGAPGAPGAPGVPGISTESPDAAGQPKHRRVLHSYTGNLLPLEDEAEEHSARSGRSS